MLTRMHACMRDAHLLSTAAVAPPSMSSLTTSVWPLRHAQCSGVLPCSLVTSVLCTDPACVRAWVNGQRHAQVGRPSYIKDGGGADCLQGGRQ